MGERAGTGLHSTADESARPYGGRGGKPPQLPKEKILSITRNHLCKGKQSLGEKNEQSSELPMFQLSAGHPGQNVFGKIPRRKKARLCGHRKSYVGPKPLPKGIIHWGKGLHSASLSKEQLEGARWACGPSRVCGVGGQQAGGKEREAPFLKRAQGSRGRGPLPRTLPFSGT